MPSVKRSENRVVGSREDVAEDNDAEDDDQEPKQYYEHYRSSSTESQHSYTFKGWTCINDPSQIALKSGEETDSQSDQGRGRSDLTENDEKIWVLDGLDTRNLLSKKNQSRKLLQLSLNQERAICRYMQKNSTCFSRKTRKEFDQLLVSLGFLNPVFGKELIIKLRAKVSSRMRVLSQNFVKAGALVVTKLDGIEKFEFADWTSTWQHQDWDGSFGEPAFWNSNERLASYNMAEYEPEDFIVATPRPLFDPLDMEASSEGSQQEDESSQAGSIGSVYSEILFENTDTSFESTLTPMEYEFDSQSFYTYAIPEPTVGVVRGQKTAGQYVRDERVTLASSHEDAISGQEAIFNVTAQNKGDSDYSKTSAGNFLRNEDEGGSIDLDAESGDESADEDEYRYELVEDSEESRYNLTHITFVEDLVTIKQFCSFLLSSSDHIIRDPNRLTVVDTVNRIAKTFSSMPISRAQSLQASHSPLSYEVIDIVDSQSYKDWMLQLQAILECKSSGGNVNKESCKIDSDDSNYLSSMQEQEKSTELITEIYSSQRWVSGGKQSLVLGWMLLTMGAERRNEVADHVDSGDTLAVWNYLKREFGSEEAPRVGYGS